LEIQALRLVVTEQDLNRAVARWLPEESRDHRLQIRLAPEGVYVTGEYSLVINVAFETLWAMGISRGRLAARLAGFRALGIPVMLLKTLILEAIGQAVADEDAIEVEDDVLLLDLERWLAKQGLAVRTNLTAVRVRAEDLVIEVGTPDGKPGA
jgi:hypothetical protein